MIVIDEGHTYRFRLSDNWGIRKLYASLRFGLGITFLFSESCLLRHILEGAVLFVMEKHDTATGDDRKVDEAIVVVVASGT